VSTKAHLSSKGFAGTEHNFNPTGAILLEGNARGAEKKITGKLSFRGGEIITGGKSNRRRLFEVEDATLEVTMIRNGCARSTYWQ